jgi:hypothetical protein
VALFASGKQYDLARVVLQNGFALVLIHLPPLETGWFSYIDNDYQFHIRLSIAENMKIFWFMMKK